MQGCPPHPIWELVNFHSSFLQMQPGKAIALDTDAGVRGSWSQPSSAWAIQPFVEWVSKQRRTCTLSPNLVSPTTTYLRLCLSNKPLGAGETNCKFHQAVLLKIQACSWVQRHFSEMRQKELDGNWFSGSQRKDPTMPVDLNPREKLLDATTKFNMCETLLWELFAH